MANLDRATRTANANTNLPDNVTQDISPLDIRQGRLDNIDSAFSLLDDYETGTLTCTLIDGGGTATYTIGGTNEFRYTRILNFVKFSVTLLSINSDVQGTGNLELNINAMPSNIEMNNQSTFVARISANPNAISNFYSIVGRADGTLPSNTISFTSQTALDSDSDIPAADFEFNGLGRIFIEGTYFI